MHTKQERVAAGITQNTLAIRSGISRMRLSQSENGEIQLKPEELETVRRVLRMEIERRARELENMLSEISPTQVSA